MSESDEEDDVSEMEIAKDGPPDLIISNE